MKVIVISLEKALDRQKYMTDVLGKKGINFEFFKALSPKDIQEDLLKNRPRNLSEEAVATFETHRKVLESIRDSGEITLVLEDDSTPIQDDVLIGIEELFKTELDWDIIFVGWELTGIYTRTSDKRFFSVDRFLGLHSYIPNPKSVDKILENIGKSNDHIDKRIANLGRSKAIKNLFTKNKFFYQNKIKFRTQIPKRNYIPKN